MQSSVVVQSIVVVQSSQLASTSDYNYNCVMRIGGYVLENGPTKQKTENSPVMMCLEN